MIYIVHDAKVRLYFYIASDIFKKVEKNSAMSPQSFFLLPLHFQKCKPLSYYYKVLIINDLQGGG